MNRRIVYLSILAEAEAPRHPHPLHVPSGTGGDFVHYPPFCRKTPEPRAWAGRKPFPTPR